MRSQFDDAVSELRTILDAAADEKRDLTPAEVARIELLEAEADNAKRQAEKAERAEELSAQARTYKRTDGPPTGNLAEDAPLTTRLWNVGNQTELRTLMTSTSSDALKTVQYWTTFEDYLANNSAAMQAGVRTVDIDSTSLHVPAGTALATGAWLAEGGTATASDIGVEGQDVTPGRLTVYAEVSNETLEDGSAPMLEAINRSLFASLGEMLDAAVFEGDGAGVSPQGMLNLAGSSTATSGGTATDLGYFVAMQEGALSANSRVKAWATNPAAWKAYADLKVGGTANYDLRPLLGMNQNAGGGAAIAGEVLGTPMYITQNIDSLGAGTASLYGFDPDQVWLVRRRQFVFVRDPFTKAEQGITRLILEGRFGCHFPRPATVQVASVLTP